MQSFPHPDTWYVHRVSYGETDTMGVLYYAEYLHLFERSRSQYIRELGMSYGEVERRGLLLPVRDARCRYRSPARYDEVIHVRAGIREWGRASLTFVYSLYDEPKERLIAEGSTQHACVNREGRPTAVPEWFRKLVP